MKLNIFYNPKCSKCRNAKSFLDNNHIDYNLIEYLNDHPTIGDIEEIVRKLNIKPLDLVRKNENLYIEKFKDKILSNSEWFEILAKNPTLIQRPIIFDDTYAIIARDEESFNTLIDR